VAPPQFSCNVLTGIAHNDIKPDNLLFDSRFNLRVADWGLSAVRCNVSLPIIREPGGTPQYMAPEKLRHHEAYRGNASDVWSAGVVLFVMLAAVFPFTIAKSSDWHYARILEGNYAAFWSAHERTVAFPPLAKDLLNRIFHPDPTRRATLEDCLQHPWTRDPATLDSAALAAIMGARKRPVSAADAVTASLPPILSLTGLDSVSSISSAADDVSMQARLPGGPAVSPAAGTPRPGFWHSLEQLPATFAFDPESSKWLFVRAEVAQEEILRSIRQHVEGFGASITHTTAVPGVQICVAFPPSAPPGAAVPVTWEVTFYDCSSAHRASVPIPVGAGVLVDVVYQRGDVLDSNFAFARLATALRSILLPPITREARAVANAPLPPLDEKFTNGVYFRDLVSAVSAGNCVAFLGSGFFGPMPGPYSSWKATIEAAVNKCVPAEAAVLLGRLGATSDPTEILAVAQAIEDRVGEERFVAVLQDLLRMPDSEECAAPAAAVWWSKMKRRIALVRAIPFRCVLTTNYTDAFGSGRELGDTDLSLVGAVRGTRAVDLTDMGVAASDREIALLRCIICPEDQGNVLPPTSPAADVEVLHIHGLRTPILSQQGLRRLLYRTSAFRPFLTTLLATSTVFYFGFSFSDSYLAELQSQVSGPLPSRLQVLVVLL
jgi:hypothetical protein